MTEFLKNTNDLQKWRQAAEYLNGIVMTTLHDRNPAAPATLVMGRAIGVLNQASNERWDSNRYLYTYAQMDTEGLVALAIEKTDIWQTALNAKACFGPVGDLCTVYQAGREKGINFNLDNALLYASSVTKFCPGLQSSGCPETAEQLFQWGANAMAGIDRYSSTPSHYCRAVRDCGVEMGKLYARHGVTPQNMAAQMVTALEANNRPLYLAFRDIYWEYGRYTVADSETLVENKEIDPSKNCQLKIIFNFASCRVNEIYDWKTDGKQSLVREFTFDDYGATAIDTARQKLIELGGKPSDGITRMKGKSFSPLELRPKK
ncbi:MAG: hypothetical protein HY052_07795 [Proteobacteria bacterium]|nr:hypothetical protein [Pseudomonadota bacterium]